MVEVAGVACRALRLGFAGELGYELHHDRADAMRLCDALLEEGADLGVVPHGLDALRLLRLEKGHILVGQDTDFDSTPAKLGMSWSARLDKPDSSASGRWPACWSALSRRGSWASGSTAGTLPLRGRRFSSAARTSGT
jgi:Aminomethyltransferase folate-binding domain